MAINKDEIKLDRTALKIQADEYHKQGFNCAQSVICALAPEIGLDPRVAFPLTEGFGIGMGGMTGTCGAISGAIVALGHVESAGFGAPTNKKQTYKLARELCDRFEAKNSSIVCRVLKGVGSEAGPLRSCPGCIDDAIDLLVDIMVESGATEACV